MYEYMNMNNRIALVAAASMSAALLLGSATSSQATLVSWWQAENNTLDSQGVNNGTAQGTVNYAPGAFGQGFSLTGSGYVDIASPTLNAYASAFTIAGWFVIDNASGAAPLMNFRNGFNNSGFTLEQGTPGNMDFYLFKTGGGGGFTLLNSPGWLLGTPYFIAATFDGATMKIYRDGSEVATRTDPADTMATVSSPLLQIGRNIILGTQWNGLIDEVQFYDNALTQSEVAALMSAVPEARAWLMLGLVVVGWGTFYAVRRLKASVVVAP